MSRPPMKNDASALRTVSINLRAQEKQREIIDQAASLLGKSRSDFMLESACKQAQDVLLDRCYFSLDGERFEAFLKLLDGSADTNDALKKTLRTPAPWDRDE